MLVAQYETLENTGKGVMVPTCGPYVECVELKKKDEEILEPMKRLG